MSAEELFETPPKAPKVFSVSELTRTVRSVLEREVGQVWVEGEIANHRRQASGHQYFTLKDENSQVSCVLFYRSSLRQPQLSDGMQVQVRGMLTVYEARGQYQLNVTLVQAAGVGLLQAKFEALKKKLQAEGLFDASHKRPLPAFPKAIGIVTSPTGAAIRDMLNILHRRAPWVEILINPVRVQGRGAAQEIAAAVSEFNRGPELGLPKVDVIVVCRGGGSAEDLWEFNEEILARAIYASVIPVVSAVGHEIDFSISDFVADLRAPTPSAAAELVVPDAPELKRRFAQIGQVMERRLVNLMESWRARLAFISRSVLFREPRQRLAELQQRLDMAQEHLEGATRGRLQEERHGLDALRAVLRHHRPDQILKLKHLELSAFLERLRKSAALGLGTRTQRLHELEGMLRVLAPQATLERGFSITLTEENEVLSSVNQVAPGAAIVTRVKDGSFKSKVL